MTKYYTIFRCLVIPNLMIEGQDLSNSLIGTSQSLEGGSGWHIEVFFIL